MHSLKMYQLFAFSVRDEIRSTVGLTNLLMRQKMKQFGELIDDSENKRGEKEITCVDLQGFWDMVYTEVRITYSCIGVLLLMQCYSLFLHAMKYFLLF